MTLETHKVAAGTARVARLPEHVVLITEPGTAAASAARWLARRSTERSLEVDVLLTSHGTAQAVLDAGPDGCDIEQVRSALAGSPAVRIGDRAVAGDDCEAAVASSLGPDLVVIGADRIDDVCRRLHAVLAAAGDPPHCPIVIVPRDWQRITGRVMVVFQGDDDDAIVAFAADEARADDTALALIFADHGPATVPRARPSGRERGGGLRRLRDLLSMRSGPIDIEELRDGTAVRTVLRGGTGAALLVVSSHRFDALHALLTGPISPAVIERAPCPVAIVHPRYRVAADHPAAAAFAGSR
jgi:nucleotide-binding universal stress UspA family protein